MSTENYCTELQRENSQEADNVSLHDDPYVPICDMAGSFLHSQESVFKPLHNLTEEQMYI
jgi:hypothetical protein